MNKIKTTFPYFTLDLENEVYILSNGNQGVDFGDCCKSIHIQKDGGNTAEIEMKLNGYPDIEGYLVSKKDTAITKCGCGEVLGYGLRGCIVRCNFCGKEHEIQILDANSAETKTKKRGEMKYKSDDFWWVSLVFSIPAIILSLVKLLT